MPDPRQFMTPDEFAALTTEQQIAVWVAADTGRVEWVPWSPAGSTRLYHRAQVQALLAQAAGTAGLNRSTDGGN